jgi:hypothetical protein
MLPLQTGERLSALVLFNWDRRRGRVVKARVRGIRLAIVVPLVAASLTVTATPSWAETGSDGADLAESALEALESIPKAGPIADAGSFTIDGDGALTSETKDSRLQVSTGDSPSIALESDFYEPLHIDGALPGQVEVTEAGTAVFDSGKQFTVVPLPHDDGSIQIITVLEDDSAPDRFAYDLSSTANLTLSLLDNGAVSILTADGKWQGGVATPWAFDAVGVPVPTHFEANGATLTQVVDHHRGDFVYPISADPYLGQNLWQWHLIDSYNGQVRVNLRLSVWGAAQATQPWIYTGPGWEEALNRSGAMRGNLLSKATMRQQFDCHAFGSAFAGDWNLEKFRPDRTGGGWSAGVAVHHCNWTTAQGY